METILNSPAPLGEAVTLAGAPARATAPIATAPLPHAGTHWLWWFFLVGTVAFASLGPTCASH